MSKNLIMTTGYGWNMSVDIGGRYVFTVQDQGLDEDVNMMELM